VTGRTSCNGSYNRCAFRHSFTYCCSANWAYLLGGGRGSIEGPFLRLPGIGLAVRSRSIRSPVTSPCGQAWCCDIRDLLSRHYVLLDLIYAYGRIPRVTVSVCFRDDNSHPTGCNLAAVGRLMFPPDADFVKNNRWAAQPAPSVAAVQKKKGVPG